MPKPNKQVQIDFIISCLQNADDRGKTLAKVGKKWQISIRTFDRLFKIAKEQHTEAQGLLKKAKTDVIIEQGIKELKLNILTAQERKEYLTKLVNGETTVKKVIGYELIMNASGKKVPQLITIQDEPNHNDRIKALAELNKMEGEYAPTKTNTKVEFTTPLPPPTAKEIKDISDKLENEC